ncbi:DUF4242 domain-containing protein [Mycobacterium conspicuum]|jgi:hypothetical protein|uniref:Uncharacterized protein n=1 Tax=Mycobacterium conspicuum TaxID=44010 RepID=A0A1X1TPC5_9MYCO|nr:DUF4242 domain-containing protein [Mycobacterium conspicuum]ORV46424.1 hypothetical protein AWC00_03690 [Mycobacterium conspicuum]BBZ40413.1 hypothetical protein MCNS_34760 [Mycobacterium conspicuum]
MTLFLYELVPAHPDRPAVDALLKTLDAELHRSGGELIEAQVTAAADRVFAVAEFSAGPPQLQPPTLDAAEIEGPHAVRLVGAELAELKALRPSAGYLVEWDLPDGLDMDSYLARKRANSPKYAQVPETSFLRTYVREDMDKCLCLYDAPDEDAVRRARQAVETPFDRLHGLQGPLP